MTLLSEVFIQFLSFYYLLVVLDFYTYHLLLLLNEISPNVSDLCELQASASIWANQESRKSRAWMGTSY